MTVQDVACQYCHQPVQPTMHGRQGARVGYYRTVTGPGKEEVREDPRTGGTVRVLRVEQVVEFLTCARCFSKPEVQARLKEARRSGRAESD